MPPPHHRGFWGSLPQVASPAGLLLANGVFGLCALLPKEHFLSWGWCVPFLLSIITLAAAVYIRVNIDETPEFRRAERGGAPSNYIFTDTNASAHYLTRIRRQGIPPL